MDSNTDSRQLAIAKARHLASKRLRKQYEAEWRTLLREAYAEVGVEVRHNRTEAERHAQKIAEAKALLEAEGLL